MSRSYLVIILAFALIDSSFSQKYMRTIPSLPEEIGDAVKHVIEKVPDPGLSCILITDDQYPSAYIIQVSFWKSYILFYSMETNYFFKKDNVLYDEHVMSSVTTLQGVGIFKIHPGNLHNQNDTEALIYNVISKAAQLRKSSRAVLIITVSNNFSFLMSFSKWSLKRRLMSPDTKLLAVTQLDRQEVHSLLGSSWTFTMMDSMVLNFEGLDGYFRLNIYSYIPYPPKGKSNVWKVASWVGANRFAYALDLQLFPHKFDDFYGHTVPVTALPFPPFWDEKKSPEDSSKITYSGTDYYLLEAIANAHNFSIFVVPTASWAEVLDKVAIRESMIAPVYHGILPERLKLFDYSYVYEYAAVDFSFSRPEVQPQWQSLYFPLSNDVWISSGVFFLIMIIIVIAYGHSTTLLLGTRRMRASMAIQELTGLLFSQNLSKQLPHSSSGRVLIGSWLVFSFILGTAYRGNLVAYLTLPKYPARPENLKELVAVADKVTMLPYGVAYKTFFSQSNSEDFRKLAEIMIIVPDVLEGQRQAIEKRQGHLNTRLYQEYHIAQKFTRIDGTTELYVGKEPVLAGKSAWPVPHDAPYVNIISRGLIALLETGLYEFWSSQLMEETKRETRKRLRKEQEAVIGTSNRNKEMDSPIMALTLIHFQGPFMILAIGLIIVVIAFSLEFMMLKKI